MLERFAAAAGFGCLRRARSGSGEAERRFLNDYGREKWWNLALLPCGVRAGLGGVGVCWEGLGRINRGALGGGPSTKPKPRCSCLRARPRPSDVSSTITRPGKNGGTLPPARWAERSRGRATFPQRSRVLARMVERLAISLADRGIPNAPRGEERLPAHDYLRIHSAAGAPVAGTLTAMDHG